MRKIIAISALSVFAAGTIAVGVFQTRDNGEPMTADLERDLSLATSVQPTRSAVVSALEQGRNGAPSGEAKGERMVVPTKKRAPSRQPSPTVTEVAAVASEVNPEPAPTAPPEVAPPTVSEAPAPSTTTADAAAPDLSYPTPAPPTGGPSAGAGNNDGRGSEDVGSGDHGRRGSGVVGVIGAILRGGSVGVDNCEPNGRRRGGTMGAIGGTILGGGGMPRGSIPGGPRSGGNRRW
ncbi:MAG: hypothetical protein ABI120_08000 [Gemmatimonadaceae bacterium]